MIREQKMISEFHQEYREVLDDGNQGHGLQQVINKYHRLSRTHKYEALAHDVDVARTALQLATKEVADE